MISPVDEYLEKFKIMIQ